MNRINFILGIKKVKLLIKDNKKKPELTKELYKEIQDKLSLVQAKISKLNDWEKTFINDMTTRINVNKIYTRLSDKQLSKLNMIFKKCYIE